MPMRGAGFITGNKTVRDGKVSDLPVEKEVVPEPEAKQEREEEEREHAEPV